MVLYIELILLRCVLTHTHNLRRNQSYKITSIAIEHVLVNSPRILEAISCNENTNKFIVIIYTYVPT